MIFISNLRSNYVAFLYGWIDGFNQLNQFLIRHRKDVDVDSRSTWKMFINDSGKRRMIASNGNDLALVENFASMIFERSNISRSSNELKIWIPKLSKDIDFKSVSDEKSYSLGRISYYGLIRAIYCHHCNNSTCCWKNLFLFLRNLNKSVGGLVEEMAYDARA